MVCVRPSVASSHSKSSVSIPSSVGWGFWIQESEDVSSKPFRILSTAKWPGALFSLCSWTRDVSRPWAGADSVVAEP